MRNLNLLIVQKRLAELNIKVLTPLEFGRIFNVSKRISQYHLEEYTKKGVFLRLKKGLYANLLTKPSPFFMANKIYQPSYISFESALSYYGLIPETVYSVTSATCKATREFASENYHFVFRRIKKEAFAGYIPKDFGGETILIAEPEKALADFYYFISLGKKRIPDRLNLRKITKKKLISWVKLFGREILMERFFNDFPRSDQEIVY
jgi:predicted transcriptional regulator of viral defense system